MSKTAEEIFTQILIDKDGTKINDLQSFNQVLALVNYDPDVRGIFELAVEFSNQQSSSKDARIAELEARLETAEKWNDVSKGELPEQNEWVLCVRKHKNGTRLVVTGQLLNNNVWSCSLDWYAAVTHWKPLPELPFLTNKTE